MIYEQTVRQIFKIKINYLWMCCPILDYWVRFIDEREKRQWSGEIQMNAMNEYVRAPDKENWCSNTGDTSWNFFYLKS